MVNISVWGVILAALSAMVIGMIWYNDALFGKQTTKILGVSQKEMKKKMPMALIVLFIVALITAYVLAHFIIYVHRGTNNGWVEAGFKTSLWAWLGLSLTTLLAHGPFDPRNKKLLLINAGNRLATLVAMGLILGASLK